MPVSSTLDEYLNKHGISEERFGEIISKAQSTVHRMRKGVITPSLETSHIVKEKTNGEVQPESFLKRHTRKPARRS